MVFWMASWALRGRDRRNDSRYREAGQVLASARGQSPGCERAPLKQELEPQVDPPGPRPNQLRKQ